MSSVSALDYPPALDNDRVSYQKQLFLYTCLVMRKQKCEGFKVLYKESKTPKFDDVVCKFKMADKEYQFNMQSIWSADTRKEIKSKILLSKAKAKNNLSKDFNVGQYFSAILDVIEESVEGYPEHKFIIFTNSSLHGNVGKHIEDSTDEIINEFFGEIATRQGKVQQFKLDKLKDIEDFLWIIFDVEDFKGIHSEMDYYIEIIAEFIRDNFILVTNSPNLDTMKELNEEMFMEDFEVTNQGEIRLVDVISEEISNCVKSKNTLNVLTWVDFENLLSKAIMKFDDVTKISSEFLKELRNDKVEFRDGILIDLCKKLKSHRVIVFECEEKLKVNALKVFQSIKKTKKEALFVPFSRLTHLQKFALKTFKGYVVILMDDEENPGDLINNENLIFVQKHVVQGNIDTPLLLESFSYEELTTDTRLNFKCDKSCFKLQIVDTSFSNLDTELLSELFVKWFNRKQSEVVNFGRELPTNRIPEVFVERDVYTLAKDKDHEKNYIDIECKSNLFTDYPQCILRCAPGMGKSSFLQWMAHDFKRRNSNHWVEVFELRKLSKVAEETGNKIFTKDEAEEFLFEKLISHGNDRLIERKLLKCYMTYKNPRIFIIFDGFDEIMPIYKDFFLSLIQQLSLLNIGVWLSERLHCQEPVREFTHFEEIYLEKFDSDRAESLVKGYLLRKLIFDCCSGCSKIDWIPSLETMKTQIRLQEEFEISFSPWKTKCHWCNNQINHQLYDITEPLENFPEEILSAFLDRLKDYFKRNRDFIESPILLKMIIDILIQEYKEMNHNVDEIFKQMENLDFLSIYDEMFTRSFGEYYEKEGINGANSKVKLNKRKLMKKIRKIHISVAVEELDLQDLLPEWMSQVTLDRATMSDILDKGFLIQDHEEKFSFSHRNFAEYFISDAIASEIERGNNKVMNYLHKQNFENDQVKEFVYHNIIGKIESEKLKTDKIIAIKWKYLSAFSRDLIQFCNFNSHTNSSKVLQFIETIISANQRQDLQPEELFAILYDREKRHSFDQFHFFLQVLEEISLKRAKVFLQTHKLQVLSGVIEDNDIVSLEKFCKVLIKYRFSQRNILGLIWRTLSNIDVKLIKHLKKIFFWYFEKKCEESDDAIGNLLNEIKCKTYLSFYFTLFLCTFEREHFKSQKCLKQFWTLIKDDNRVYDFLSCFEPSEYEKNESNAEVIFSGECLKVLHEIQYNFLVTENCSTMQKLFFDNKYVLFGQIFEVLPDETVATLAKIFRNWDKCLPHLELKTIDCHVRYIYIFMKYVCKKFNRKEIEECLKPFEYPLNESELHYTEILLRRDLNCAFYLTLFTKSAHENDFYKEIILKFCKNALDWEKKHNLKLYFLHNVIRVGHEGEDRFRKNDVFYKIIFDFLHSEDILLSKLSERDQCGFLPAELAVMEHNLGFLKLLYSKVLQKYC